ncbi:unnamed protein product [Arabidopsis thaliana]|uniref:Uncharacterized protein n=1 Tax=Arabidopsis thaliana TaxID=3702 RepID=Q9LSV2_ARATH|nr:unnamed protein product [Arabidopsis thaliana]
MMLMMIIFILCPLIASFSLVSIQSCSHGCIDLSDILKVTEGYGKSVSLSVMSGNEVIFRKESQIEERELRLLTEELVSLLAFDPEIVCIDQLPDCCAAGTNLMNLIFQVMELDGSLDTSIHHDEKPGCFHTMSIESDSSSIESAIRYAFVHGSCKVSSLSLPENEGVFSCRVFHSRYPELQMSVKIQVTSAPTSEREESGYSTPHSITTPPPESGIPSITNPWQTPCSQFGVLAIRSSSSLALSSETSLMDMPQYTEV